MPHEQNQSYITRHASRLFFTSLPKIPFFLFPFSSRPFLLDSLPPFLSDSEQSIPFVKMDVKSKGLALTTVLFYLGLSAIFPLCFSAANQPRNSKQPTYPISGNRFGSSAVFQVQGNVYPLGYVYYNFLDFFGIRLIKLLFSSNINLRISRY